jgi:hypothetical protein
MLGWIRMDFYEMNNSNITGHEERQVYRDLPCNVNEKMGRRKWMNDDVKYSKRKENCGTIFGWFQMN